MKDPNACRTPERRRQIAALAGAARGRKLSKERLREIAQMGQRASLVSRRAKKAAALAAQSASPPSPLEEGEGDAA